MQLSILDLSPLPARDFKLVMGFLEASEGWKLFGELLTCVPWSRHSIQIAGKTILSPRLSAWYGDPGMTYSYSNLFLEANPWLPVLLDIKARVETACKTSFNSVLLNRYRDGTDSVAWHSDDEPELGETPIIASLSLGASRMYQLKPKSKRPRRVDILLNHGDLLIMKKKSQQEWMHRVPKATKPTKERINLTFRKIQDQSNSSASA